jgi:DNA-binding transcriptional MerR regulator
MKSCAPQTIELPDKLYFKIGEVSRLADVPTYVLRFWETEFSRIKPKRTRSGQRLYRQKDVALIMEIKHLLHKRKFTIEGARRHLKAPREIPEKKPAAITIAEVCEELKRIRELLS